MKTVATPAEFKCQTNMESENLFIAPRAFALSASPLLFLSSIL